MNTIKPDTETSEGRQHYEILDGLRGIAAISVVVFHFMEWIFTDPTKNFIGHGFLAVDFFFCLSGFVIAYAYDHRIKSLGVKSFLLSRLIRLHPLVVFGSLLGLIGFYIDPFATHSIVYTTGQMLLLLVCSIFMVPLPIMEDRGFNLFGLNAPSWSLFWEYIANIVYAFVLSRIGRGLLIVLTIAAAIGIIMVSLRAGNLLGGWSGGTFWDGGVRVAYSFLAGLLIYRSRWIIKNKIGFLGLSILLIAAFMIPVLTLNWLFEALIVLLYFPLIVSLGAGTLNTSWLKNICTLSGRLSYPLYMTHYFALWIFGNYYTTHQPGTRALWLIIIGGTFSLLLIAFLVEKYYDAPIRRYLNGLRNRQG